MNGSDLPPPPPDEPDPTGQPTIDLDCTTDAPPDLAWLSRMAAAVVDALRLVEPDVSFIIIDDERMASMHVEFSNVEGTTDVLTFDLRDEPFDARSLVEVGEPIAGVEGEIYICLDEARRRAAERSHSVERELLLYITHGLLHLVGYDDHRDEDYAAMHAREDMILESLGVGAVFSAPNEQGGAK